MKSAAAKAAAKIDETLKSAGGPTAEQQQQPPNPAPLGDWVKTAAAKTLKVASEQAAKAASRIEEHLKDAAAEAAARRAVDAEAAAARQVVAAEIDALKSVVDARFPESDFPRTPEGMIQDFGNSPNFREDFWDVWKKILEVWPEPPQDELIRQQREELYWNEEVRRNLVESEDGVARLRSKPLIISKWASQEKWHSRKYFAATGILQRSVYGHEFIYNWKITDDSRNVKGWNTADATSRSKMEATHKARDFIKDFFLHTIRDHEEKWGNWYFFHVEQAYKKLTEPAPRSFSKPSDEL